MGSAVALRLAQRGVGVTVIERGIPGAEASSAAAGILGPQMEAEGPGPLLELGLRSRALYPALAAELRDATGIDVGYERSGVLAVALDERGRGRAGGAARLAARARPARRAAVRRRAAHAREPALGPGDARGAALSRRRAGQRARAGARVLAGGGRRGRALPAPAATCGACVIDGGAAIGVELDGEVLPAGAVVVAAGSWSGLVEGGGRARHGRAPGARPAGVDRDAPAAVPPRASRVHGRGYLVPRRDGTVIAGSTVEMVGFRKEVTVGGLAADPDAGAHAGARRWPTRPSPAPGRTSAPTPRTTCRCWAPRRCAAWCSRPATSATASCWRPITAEADRRAGRDRAGGDRPRAVLGDPLRGMRSQPRPASLAARQIRVRSPTRSAVGRGASERRAVVGDVAGGDGRRCRSAR